MTIHKIENNKYPKKNDVKQHESQEERQKTKILEEKKLIGYFLK